RVPPGVGTIPSSSGSRRMVQLMVRFGFSPCAHTRGAWRRAPPPASPAPPLPRARVEWTSVRRNRALVLVLLGSTGGLVASCSPRRPPIRNVLLISIDTLRADHVSSYGFPRRTTPTIDAVARRGRRVRNA